MAFFLGLWRYFRGCLVPDTVTLLSTACNNLSGAHFLLRRCCNAEHHKGCMRQHLYCNAAGDVACRGSTLGILPARIEVNNNYVW